MYSTTPTARQHRASEEIREDKYDLARVRIEDGRWRVDAEAGHVYNDKGERIGYVKYRSVLLSVQDAGVVKLLAQRVIWESVHGPIPGDNRIGHLNGQTLDNRISNLVLESRSQSSMRASRAAAAAGPPLRGEAHPSSRLTEAQVRQVLADRAAGASRHDVAAKYSVDYRRVCDIVAGRAWAHLQREAA